jgi:hypothetical protein
MSQLRVEAEGATGADPEVVWSLVADANSYPFWGPWNDGGYQPASEGPSRKGSIQWFRYGRHRLRNSSSTWMVTTARRTTRGHEGAAVGAVTVTICS